MSHTHVPSPAIAYARSAGLIYLIIAVVGGFSIGYVPGQLMPDGSGAPAELLMTENLGLYRLGLLGDTIVIIAEIILTAILYTLFRPVNPTASMVAAMARFSMVAVMAINLLIYALPLILSGNLGAEALNTLTIAALKAHQFGVYVWGILFGLHLLALGYLVLASGFCPRILGWMMMIGSLGYSIEGIAKITATHGDILSTLTVILLVIVTLGELSFALWLLIRGGKIEI